mmetsp:Transcript_10540/g.20264  ORF Transcript_10540/g.20264 Transcript_10540/m.20264 type:complete len:203 (+) Transcript_10540:3852-4460(+)
MELESLFEDHRLNDFSRRLEVVESPIKRHLSSRLFCWVVKVPEISMAHTLLDRPPLVRVEHQHLVQQIKRDRVRLGVDRAPLHLLASGEFMDIAPGCCVGDEVHIFRGGGPEHSDNSLNLVQVVFTWEKRGSSNQLCEDAADAPHVDLLTILTGTQDDFRGAVPPCNYIFSQVHCFSVVPSRQAEVADFEVAVLVEEEIAWL